MATGHIKLGKLSDTTLREYALENEAGQRAQNANPFVAHVSSGGPYTNLDDYSEFTIQTWASGVGHKNPEEGQYFSLGETRYPGYLVGAPVWDYPITVENQSPSGYTVLNATIFSTSLRSTSFVATKTADIYGLWVYVAVPSTQLVTVSLWSDNGSGKPLASLKSKTITSAQERPHLHWERFTFASAQAVVSGTRYHVVVASGMGNISGDYNITPYVGVRGVGSEKQHTSTDLGTNWTLVGTNGIQYLIIYGTTGVGAREIIRGTFISGSDVFVWYDNVIAKIVAGALVSKVSGVTMYDVKQIDDVLYISYGTGYKRYTMATDATVDVAATASYMMLLHAGYLWRSTGSGVAYTADETIWTPIDGVTGFSGNTITGMAGLGDTVYVASTKGLYGIYAGDFPVQVAAWPDNASTNGVGMVQWEGALYIPTSGGSIMRYDSTGALLNVGINARAKMPDTLKGNVTSLYSDSYFLYATVDAQLGTTRYPSLWSYNVEGWHCLGIGPQGEDWGGSVAVDKVNGYLYWGGSGLILRRTPYYNSVTNPVHDMIQTEYVTEAWVEYEKFYGSYAALNKDFDRVFIDNENAPSIGRYHIYFKSSINSKTEWTYAGYYDGGLYGEPGELLFPGGFRPQGKWIKLGIRIERYNSVAPFPTYFRPLLTGLSLKYAVNVADKSRWVLPLLVSNNQDFPDGSVNPYTAAQQKAHIELLIREVAPLKFVDILGTPYLVKITGWSADILRYNWDKGTNTPNVQMVYTLQVVEVSLPVEGTSYIYAL